MRYFRLMCDKEAKNPIMPIKLAEEYKYNLKKADFDVMDAGIPAYYKQVGYPSWCDFLFRPLFMISNRYKEMWEDTVDLEFKAVVLLPEGVDPEKIEPEDCCSYWVPFKDQQDVLHEATEYLGTGTISRLILDAEKINPDEDVISLCTRVEQIWIVSLPMAEEILSMGPLGLILQEVEVR